MIDKKYIYAIIGASNNTHKYGYKVLKDLKDSGYKVVPINPGEDEILGLKTYKSILDVGLKIDVAIFIVPPAVTEKAIKQVKKLKINNVWLQPGSESKKAIKYCQDNNINCVHSACIMVNRGERR